MPEPPHGAASLAEFPVGALEKLPIGLALVDAGDRIIFLNERARAILGYGVQDLGDVRAWLERAISDPGLRLRAGRVWSRDRLCHQTTRRFYARMADGRQRFIEVRQQAWDQGSRLITINDLTKRRRTEEALRLSESLFGKLFRANPSAVVITSLEEGRILDLNDSFARLTGFGRQESVGRTTQEMGFWLDPAERDRFARLLVHNHGSVSEYETTATVRGNVRKKVLISAEVVEIDGRDCVIAACVDVTERRRMVQALAESERRYRELAELLPQPLFEADLAGRFTFANQAGLKAFGYGEQDLAAGRCLADGVVPDERERVVQGIANVLAGQGMGQAAYTMLRQDGTTFPGLISAAPILSEGRPVGLRGVVADVSELKRAEEALRESEAKFRTLTETADCGIFIIQGERYVYMNPAGERITGYTAPQLYTMEFWSVIHPDFRELVRFRGLARQRGEKVPNHYEFKLVRPDGGERWVDFAAGVVEYQGGPAMLGTAFDITERKQAEELLRLDEERLEALVRLGQMQDSPARAIIDFALEEAVKLTHSEMGYLAFLDKDEATLEMSCWSREALSQCAVRGRPPTSRLEHAGLWGEAARQRRPVITNDYPASALRKGLPEGHFPIARHMSAPVIEGGRIVAVAGVGNKREPYDDADARQVTLLMDAMWKILQHQRAQEALRQSEERFRSVAENAPDIIYTLNREGVLTYVNPAWERILGYKNDEVLGRHYIDFARPQDARAMVRVFKRIRDEGQTPAGVEGLLLSRDGRPRHFVMSGGPNLDSAGRVTGMVGMLKDVTGQMELEAQLRHAQKMEAVGTLAGGVAHEFNNALMAIRGYAQLLGLSAQTGANAAELLAKIDQSCQRAADLTTKMLTFTRIETGEKAAVDVNQVAEGVWEVFRQTVPPRIALSLELEPGLPPVLGNAQQLEQVILNLVLNARDASQAGGEITLASGRLELDAQAAESRPWARPGPYLTVEVADTGEGMTPEVVGRIFDPFFTTKEPGRGTGLGLAVAYSILKGHGGHIEAQSAPGQGSRFTVYLPLGAAPAPQEQSEAAAEDPPSGRGENILVVDDEPQLREIASEMLKAFGYHTQGAANGREALALYQEALEGGRPHALVLLDLAMPVMDGHECLERLTALYPEARVLVTTGHGGEQGEGGLLARNARGVLRKPYNLTQLLSQVRRALDD